MIVPSQFSHFWSNQKMKMLYLLTGTPPLPAPGAGPPGTVPLAAARACNNKQPNPSTNTVMDLSDLSHRRRKHLPFPLFSYGKITSNQKCISWEPNIGKCWMLYF
jgi:hypothetical protein